MFFSNDKVDLHQTPDQLSRQESAKNTVIKKLNLAARTGEINDYQLSLIDCSCSDFRRRKLPCKHIYRLAHELKLFNLGVFKAPTNYESSSRKNSSSIKKQVAELPKEIQLELHRILYQFIYKKKTLLKISDQLVKESLLINKLIVQKENIDLLAKEINKDTWFSLLTDPTRQIKKSSTKEEVAVFYKENYPKEFNDLIYHFPFVELSESMSENARAVYNDLHKRYKEEVIGWYE